MTNSLILNISSFLCQTPVSRVGEWVKGDDTWKKVCRIVNYREFRATVNELQATRIFHDGRKNVN